MSDITVHYIIIEIDPNQFDVATEVNRARDKGYKVVCLLPNPAFPWVCKFLMEPV